MKKLSLMVVWALVVFAFSVGAEDSVNLLKNGELTIPDGKSSPTSWVADKSSMSMVKEGILATLKQAVRVEVKEANKQHGYIYQFASPKGGFDKPFILIQGYVKSKMKNGAFIQLKFFKGRKKLKIVNLSCTFKDKWQLLKQTYPLEGVDKVQVLCRYYRGKAFVGNVVEFGDISLSTTDKSLNDDGFDKKAIKVVVLGDSTVQTFAPGLDLVGWGQLIHSAFKDDVGVHNHALSGRSSKTFIKQGLLDKALKDKPNYALIQFGHNDSHGKGRPESTDADTDYKEYLRQYVDAFDKIGAKVVFVTPMCRMTFGKNGKLSDRLQPYADAMKEVAKEKNCVVLDLHSASMSLFKSVGPKSVKLYGGRGGTDRTHFSQAGAEEITKLIINDLKNSESPLGKHLKP